MTNFKRSESDPFDYTYNGVSEWKGLAIAQCVIFGLTMVCAVFTTFYFRGRGKRSFKIMRTFGIFVSLFMALKFAGGILIHVSLTASSPSVGLITSVFICNNVGFGLIIRSMFPFLEFLIDDGIQYEVESDKENETYSKKMVKNNNMFLRAFQIVILVAMITTIVGATDIGATSKSDINEYVTLTKVSAALFFVSAVMILLMSILGFIKDHNRRRLASVIFLASLCLLVRSIYMILSASVGGFDKDNRYLILFGEWRWYAFMGMLMEFICCVALIICNVIIQKTVFD